LQIAVEEQLRMFAVMSSRRTRALWWSGTSLRRTWLQGSSETPPHGIRSRIIKRDTRLVFFSGSVGVANIKRVGESVEGIIPAAEMQTGAEVLIFAGETMSVRDDIGEKGVGELSWRFSVDSQDLGAPAKDGIASIQIDDHGHRVRPELHDQWKLRQSRGIQVMRIGLGIKHRSMATVHLGDDPAEDGPELRLRHRIADRRIAPVEKPIHAVF
jgi:hypothetical protein